jgi:hypothetical protein
MNRAPFLFLLGCACMGVTVLGYWLGWRQGHVVEPGPDVAPTVVIADHPARPAMQEASTPAPLAVPRVTLEETWNDIVRHSDSGGASRNARETEELVRRLQAMSSADLAELLKRLDEPGRGTTSDAEVWNIAVNLLASRDPAAAFELLVAPHSPNRMPAAASLVFERWVEIDPSSAWRAVQSWSWLPAPEAQTQPGDPRAMQQLVSRMFQRWGAKDFDAAYEVWRETKEPRLRDEVLRGLASSATTADEHARLFGRIEAEPPGAGTTRDLAFVVGRWSKADSLDTVSARIDSLDLPGEDKAVLERAAAYGAAPSDPPAAIAWLAARTPPEQHAADTAEIVRSWSQNAPNACGEWLARQPPGPGIDPAIARFVHEIVSVDAASALAWSRRITEPSIRRDAARLVFIHWHGRAPAEALRAAQNLPAADRDWLEPFLTKKSGGSE